MMQDVLGNDAETGGSYHVEWFVRSEAQRDVTVTIGDGRVLGVEAGRTAGAIELGSVALVDGLVNVHTHLEFSRLIEPVPMTGLFTDWIRNVVRHRREHPDDVGDAIRKGIAESVKSGTTLLGEISTVGWVDQDYIAAGFRGVVFQEVLGLSPERIAQQSELARTHLMSPDVSRRPVSTASASKVSREPIVPNGEGSFSRGVSPHAPYSTHFELVQNAVNVAIATGQPIAMHIAETEAELELLATGTGEFRDLLTDFGIWRDDLFDVRRRPMDYLELLSQAPRSLVIHGNYLTEEEFQFVAARPQMTVVYCPRTHAAFGHSKHPWRRLLELGGRVALGTDSRASNPDLSLFAELKFLAGHHPEISHLELLRIGSSNGRHALGFSNTDGANLTLIRLGHAKSLDIEQGLFGPGNTVCGTMMDGRWMG